MGACRHRKIFFRGELNVQEEIFLPTLPHWQFGNDWSGSKGEMRFAVKNAQIKDENGGSHQELLVEVWNEDVCRELATVLDTHTFQCTQEDLEAMNTWLLEKYRELG